MKRRAGTASTMAAALAGLVKSAFAQPMPRRGGKLRFAAVMKPLTTTINVATRRL